MKHCRRARHPIIAVLLAIGTGIAQAADEAPVAIEAVCTAASMAELPATLDFDAEFARVEAMQAAQDPQMLTVGCRAWAFALRNGPALQVLRAQANVGSSLFWQGRPIEARTLLADAYPRLLAVQPPRWSDAAETAGLLSAFHFQRNETDAALLWTQRGVDAAAQPGSGIDARSLLRLRMNLAELLSGLRRMREAEAMVDGLIAQTTLVPDFVSEHGNLLHTRSVLLQRQDRIEAGIAASRAEIAFREKSLPKENVGMALALQTLGVLLTSAARYSEAEAALRDAIRVGSTGGTDLWAGLAGAYESLSRLLEQRGQPVQALQAAREAVALLDAGPAGKTPRAARPLRYLAQAQLASGDVGGALITLRRALALLDSGQGRTDTDTEWALRLAHLRVLLVLGDLEGAQAASERSAVVLAGLPLAPRERSDLLAAQAAVAHRRGDEAAAQKLLDEADAALAALFPISHPQRVGLQVQRCAWWGRDCATLAAQAAISDQPKLRAQAALALALRAASGAGKPQAQAQAQLAMAAALDAAAPDLQWQADATYFAVLRAAGRRTEAIFFGKTALGLLEGMRNSLLPLGAGAEAQYLADKGGLYRDVAAELLKVGRVPEALDVLRLLKRSEQNDFNERAATAPADGLNLTPQEQAWQRSLDAVGAKGQQRASEIERLRRLAAAQHATPEEAARLKHLQAEQTLARPAVQASLDAVLAEFRLAARLSERRKATTTASANQLHGERPRDARSLHAYFISGPDRLSLLLLGPHRQQILQLPLPAATLGRQVGALLDAVRRQAPVLSQSQALYEVLGRPIDAAARQQGAERIVLWLDGALRYLPLGLLHDGRQFLAERYAFSVVGPAGTARREANVPALTQVHAWGVTLALADLPALPGVGAELCGIVDGPLRGLSADATRITQCHGALPGQADTNAFFTASALAAAGPAAPVGGVIHIGTHFVLRPGNASKSWLLLGDGSRLTLDRMRELPLGSPRLVTLSACETAVPGGVDADGRELEGLAGTLLSQGAAQVLASLWRVDDPSTAQLMRGLYQALARQSGDVPAALQQAQRAAILADLPARSWAAFEVLQAAPQ